MAIVISGVNNNDKITATDGTIDLLSGVNYSGILTAPALTSTGNITAASVNVGNNIQVGNAGIITATTLIGNVTGNVNHTSNLLLQISGAEKLRIANSGAFGLNGTNYGSSGQVLTSQGSGSSPVWSTVSGTTINTNADNRIITGSDSANTLNGESNLTYDGSTLALTGGFQPSADIAFTSNNCKIQTGSSGHNIQIQGGATNPGGTIKVTGGNSDGDIRFYAQGATSTLFERLRIASTGNLALGNTHAAKKIHISTTGNQKVLIDPNYNNVSGGSSNGEADAGNIVESILIRTSFGSNAATQTNAGHKWGIKFQGYNGNDFTQATAKCAGVYAVSEDEATGYNNNVGLAFHTSPYNTAHREVMRINTNGAVTKPYQYVFIVETNGTSKTANWSKITGLSPDASQCTGVSDGTYWSNSNQQFTAPVTGVYHFFVGGWATSASNGSRYAYTFKHTNGNNYNYIGGGNYSLVDSPMDGFSRTIKLSAGEWVELWGFSSVSTTWGGGHRFFWGGYLLG